jgi:hypothetical protein
MKKPSKFGRAWAYLFELPPFAANTEEYEIRVLVQILVKALIFMFLLGVWALSNYYINRL